ncbi:M12 family metallopeptidase [Bdellovibrio sp. ArHS]|uniref:M12 family metallopeptidase n=1 Tax=Bdellovibrio sp. ArHS TaxID=1569284 RepID=UPI000A5FBCB7|nr:M12 family metallopeptidase [Bdellovibrio sp. ArHS]
MSNRILVFLLILLLVVGTYVFSKRDNSWRAQTAVPTKKQITNNEQNIPAALAHDLPAQESGLQSEANIPASHKQVEILPQAPLQKTAAQLGAVHYRIEDGMAVADGDILLGQVEAGAPPTGLTKPLELQLWDSSEIAIYIQPDLENPQRVREALLYFANTPIRFVDYTDQEDVLVFQTGSKDCKSYLGKVGGKQPVWLAPNCAPAEIAHEIMHALGFIHEQNRTDREAFVQVLKDNVEEGYLINFEIFPPSLMKVSGLAPFDYNSLMLYPSDTFAKPGTSQTLVSKDPGRQIAPLRALSQADIQRLYQAYGNR